MYKGRMPLTFKKFQDKCLRYTFDKYGKPKHTRYFRKLFIRFSNELLDIYGLDLKKCNNEKCGITHWHNLPLIYVGELHHVNGITNDSRPSNLKFYCSNCHTLTKNYKGRIRKTEQFLEKQYNFKFI